MTSLIDRLKKKYAEARVAGKHPLCDLGADLNVRTAYFQGLTLVAFVDDDKIDSRESAYLQKLGAALGMTADDVSAAIAEVTRLQGDGDQQEALVSDVVSTVSDSVMRKLFLAEMTCLSTVHNHDWGRVKELRSVFADMMGCDLKESGFKAFDEVHLGLPKTAASVPALEKFFSKPMLDYLFPGYADLIKKETVKQREAAQKEEAVESAKLAELKKWLLTLVKKDEWVKSYDLKAIRVKFAWAGVKDRLQTTFLRLLTPHARKAFEAFKRDLPGMECSTNYSDRILTISDYVSGCELLNFCSLMSAFTTKADLYRVVDGPPNDDGFKYCSSDDTNFERVANGTATPSRIVWSWRSKDGERNAKNACCKIFDRILSEFEFRATW